MNGSYERDRIGPDPSSHMVTIDRTNAAVALARHFVLETMSDFEAQTRRTSSTGRRGVWGWPDA